MAGTDRSADDPPFHHEIWRGPKGGFGTEPKAIYYVENHNAQCGYGDLAEDFEKAARALLEIYRDCQLGNWMAPVAHLVRQTLELGLKALVSSIRDRDPSVPAKALGAHGLEALWTISTRWLDANGFPAVDDARLDPARHLVAAYDAIDPSGDLFRFGISRRSAFGKSKSYDRVGLVLDTLDAEFDAATSFLRHWDTAVWRDALSKAEGWTRDEFFDADDFPRRDGGQR